MPLPIPWIRSRRRRFAHNSPRQRSHAMAPEDAQDDYRVPNGDGREHKPPWDTISQCFVVQCMNCDYGDPSLPMVTCREPITTLPATGTSRTGAGTTPGRIGPEA